MAQLGRRVDAKVTIIIEPLDGSGSITQTFHRCRDVRVDTRYAEDEHGFPPSPTAYVRPFVPETIALILSPQLPADGGEWASMTATGEAAAPWRGVG